MSTEDTIVTRRHLFLAGGAGALALAGMSSAASAHGHEMNAEEKANAKVVSEFVQQFNDPEKMMSYLADDAMVRMFEDKPAITGKKTILEEVKKLQDPKVKFEVQIHETEAMGPVVTNRRSDIAKTVGKPDQTFKVVGVFLVKGGKIKEWVDYIVT